MIILEGFDNSGKTTLGIYLSKKLKIPIQHSIEPINYKQATNSIIDMITRSKPRIYDRWSAISELVYGPILREKSVYEDHNWHWIEIIIRHMPIIIYCRPPDDIVLNFENNPSSQMWGVIEEKENLLKRYDEVMGLIKHMYHQINMDYLFYNYNWTMYSKEILLKSIRIDLERWNRINQFTNRLALSERLLLKGNSNV